MMLRATFSGFVCAMLLGLSCAAFAVDVEPLPTPEMQQRFDDLTHEFRCMQCQNQSIADSAVGLAADLRRDVREQIIAGKSDAEIRASMVARYGNVILFRPPFEKSTAWVWLVPILLLLVGVYVAFRVVRQRAGMVATDDSVVEQDEVKP
jgi:cytochrome c-type biogenesis protein CcmH/NrfF